MNHVDTSLGEHVDFGAMKLVIKRGSEEIEIIDAKRTGLEYQNFWTNVRNWFDQQQGTSVKIAHLLGLTHLGVTLYAKLSRSDEYSRFMNIPPSNKFVSFSKE